MYLAGQGLGLGLGLMTLCEVTRKVPDGITEPDAGPWTTSRRRIETVEADGRGCGVCSGHKEIPSGCPATGTIVCSTVFGIFVFVGPDIVLPSRPDWIYLSVEFVIRLWLG